MKLSMQTGSEGPRHDPYGYTEYSVKTERHDVTLHLGLGTWLEMNGDRTSETVDTTAKDLEDKFKELTGLTVGEFEEKYEEENGPPDKCPHCGNEDLDEGRGYVGETVIFCKPCGTPVWEDGAAAMRLAE